MPSLLNPADRAAMLERLRRLSPSDQRKWGTLDAPRMLCHIADQMRVGLGDIPTAFSGSLLTTTLLKWLVVGTSMKAPPEKAKTAPEMLLTKPAAWENDLAASTALIERVGSGQATATHPAFGRLSPAEWGALTWKHLDHHLRQFGR